MSGNTKQITIGKQNEGDIRNIITSVYAALNEKGYDPISQIVGYLISGDPTYVTSYNGARGLISRVERDELIEELVKNYIKTL